MEREKLIRIILLWRLIVVKMTFKILEGAMKKIQSFFVTIRVNIIFLLCIFAVLFSISRFGFSGDTNERLEFEVKRLTSLHGMCFYQAIVELHKHGKESIPLLIDQISNCEKPTNLVFLHPLNSYIAGIHRCYGFLYAYIVELILAREKIKEETGPDDSFLGPVENYVYWYGILWKKGKIAVKQDLVEIQRTYRIWWEKNKGKSLEELRSVWNNKKRPLSGSVFFWN